MATAVNREIEPVEFTAIREDWNDYELEDSGYKVRLRGKLIATKVRLGKGRPTAPGFSIGSQVVWVSFAPREIRGEPTLPAPTLEEIEANIVVPELPFSTIRESWNEYNLKGVGILRLKVVLIRVSKTSVYVADGDPLYFIRSDSVADFIPLKPKAAQGHPTFTENA